MNLSPPQKKKISCLVKFAHASQERNESERLRAFVTLTASVRMQPWRLHGNHELLSIYRTSMRCKCGHIPNEPNAKFCSQCGQPLAAQQCQDKGGNTMLRGCQITVDMRLVVVISDVLSAG